MKKIILLAAVMAMLIAAQAQEITEKNVPAAVTAAFHKSHSVYLNSKWSMVGANYKVDYMDADKMHIEYTYDASGRMVQSEMQISAAGLPGTARDYMKRNYKEGDIKEVSELTDAGGTVTYEVEIIGVDLIFDAIGNFVKSVTK